MELDGLSGDMPRKKREPFLKISKGTNSDIPKTQEHEKVEEKKDLYIREEKEEGKRGKGCVFWFFIIILIIAVLTVAIIGGVVAYKYFTTKDKVIVENESGGAPALLGAKNVSGITSDPEDVEINKEMINILLLGIGGTGHSGGSLTDVIQIFSFNTKTKKALLVSVPRDLYVNIENYGFGKINEMYQAGERNGRGKGGATAKKEAEEVTGIPIHYFAKIDFAGFVRMVDELGGVDIIVDKPIADSSQDTYISAGAHHFSGEEALKYVRSRKTTSDFDRSERQQKVLVAVKEKTTTVRVVSNPFKINKILNVLSDNFITDISIAEARKLAIILKDFEKKDMKSYVLNNNPTDKLLYSTYNSGGQYVLLPIGGSYNKIQEFIEKILP